MRPGDLKKLTDDEIRELFSKPMSKEEEDALRKLDEEDGWLLALNLMEMDLRESDPNYDPADDPTCVLISNESDEE